MTTLFDDLRFTLRQLRRSRGFLAVTVLTLTFAIAANAVVYGVANTLLLRPLPVHEPRQLVQVQNVGGFAGVSFSYPNYRDLAQRSTGTFSSVALARLTRLSMNVHNLAEPVWGYLVSGNYFSTLGLQPELGSFIRPEDDVTANGSPVVVLSDAFWRGQYQADPNIVGKRVLVGKVPFTVIGVAPRGFRGTEQFFVPDVWLPFHDGPEIDGGANFEQRGSTNAEVYARLRPGVTRAEADADLRRISEQMSHEYPDDVGTAWFTSSVGLYGAVLQKAVRAFIAGLALLAAIVFLAACANLSVLFSSRTADRTRELGIRLALGSSRKRLLRQLLMESMLIAALGGVVASLSAKWLLHLVNDWQPPSGLPARLFTEADWRVYAASAAFSLATGLLFGLLPARQVWRTDPNRSIRAAGSTAPPEHNWFRSGMLLAQITLCCLLITASTVAIRGLQRLSTMPLGFDPNGVALANLDVKLAGYSGASQVATQQRLLEAVKRIPGVTEASYSNNQPLSLNTNTRAVYRFGTTIFDPAHAVASPFEYRVAPGYFSTTRTRLIAGRSFTDGDNSDAPRVAIVNETLARSLFGTTAAVGKQFSFDEGKPIQIVGVAEDGKYFTLSEDPTPAMFLPMLQYTDSTELLIARTDRDPVQVAQAIRAAIAGADNSIPVFSATSWNDALRIVTFPARAATLALGMLGGLAAMLAITGIFGVASYTVSRRMREFGIRTALGAGVRDVLRAALGGTILLIGAGSLLGLLLGIASGKLLAAVVYHASAADPLVLLSAVFAMLVLGIVATLVPARRALSVTPAELLREQ